MSNSVLIVDDAEFMRLMLKDIIEDLGWSVCAEAADGQESIDLYRQHKPDIVLMDITMPTMDGIDALQAILAQDSAATVVMITALGQKDHVLKAIKAGARDFVIKPFDAERVQDTLQRLLCPV